MKDDEVNEKLWKILVVVFSIVVGIFFLTVALFILLIGKHEISSELFFAVRLLLALGAGFVSAGILGTINIEIKPKITKTTKTETNGKKKTTTINEVIDNTTIISIAKGYQMTLTAGGPIAITVLVWIYSPEVLHLIESVVIY